MVGAVAQNKSYSEMMKDPSGHSTGLAGPSQTATKAGASDKTALSQQNDGRASHTAGQASSINSDQLTPLESVKVDNSGGQNPQVQGVSGSGNANTVSEPFKDHGAVNGNSAAPSADETAYPQADVTPLPMSPAQTLRLVQNLSDTEMRMGIQAGEFGKIDIHTSINQSQISARIYVEHDELGKALAETLPQLHEKLSVEHRVDAQIQLYNSGSSYSSGSDRQQHQQQQGAREQEGTVFQGAGDSPLAETVQEPSDIVTARGLDMEA